METLIAILGAVVLLGVLLRFFITVWNMATPTDLPPRRYGGPARVSVLVPARNEEQNIVVLLESLRGQTHPPHEVIVLDDHSADKTLYLLRGYQASHPAFPLRVMEGAPLPEGWPGKNFACHQLAGMAGGNFLLFVDADVRLAPQAIESALGYAEERRTALLSLFPTQTMRTAGEKLMVPLMMNLLLQMLALHWMRISKKPDLSGANGQFMLYTREAYFQTRP